MSSQPHPPASHNAIRRSAIGRVGVVACLGLVTPGALAGIAIQPQEILSPFDDAQVSVEWTEPVYRVGGYVRWANPTEQVVMANVETNLFGIGSVATGTKVILPELFQEQQELVLGFAETQTSDLMTRSDDDWSAVHLDIVRVTPAEYRIYAPGLAEFLDGRDPYDHAMIIVRFAQLPAPGAACVLGLMPLLARRRR